MASKKTVNLANLEALGAKRLAEILLELGMGDAGVKRRLRLELSAEAGAEAVAADIGKRLTTLRQARSFIDWEKRRAFVKDLDLQRQLIVEKVVDTRPDLALELMWRFMGLAEPVLNRVDDSRGDVGEVFRRACAGSRCHRRPSRARSGAARRQGLRGCDGQRLRRVRPAGRGRPAGTRGSRASPGSKSD